VSSVTPTANQSRILFTAGNSLLSKAIRARTQEPVSHVALECNGWVVHSNLLGVRVDKLSDFEKHCRVVYSIPVEMTAETILTKYREHQDASYDFGALLYMFLKLTPGITKLLPERNLWRSTGAFLCTEWVTHVIYGKELSSITPYQLYKELSK